MAMRTFIDVLTRGVIGFVAGFVVACFALVFLGILPPQPHTDLSQPEIEQQGRALWMALYVACGVGLVSIAIGQIRLSRFWLWFVMVFGITCVVPFWPHKDGSFLPFATPYVNFGFHMEHVWMLVAQLVIAFGGAAMVQWGWPRLTRRRAM